MKDRPAQLPTSIEDPLDPDPIGQFERWLEEAIHAGLPEPTAMTLATCTADGQPSARMVLLKDVSPGGFSFYTNYESRKGSELEANPRAALVFFWALLARQVRIEGDVERLSREESGAYFRTRPRAARIGAWASAQSCPIESRAALHARVREIEGRFQGEHVPLPPFWGGYRVRPSRIEFWQGRESRLHDRYLYRRDAHGSWRIERLMP